MKTCNPMHRVYGALPVPYVLVRVTRSALVAYRHTIEPVTQCGYDHTPLSVR